MKDFIWVKHHLEERKTSSPSWQQSAYWLGIGKAKDSPWQKLKKINKK